MENDGLVIRPATELDLSVFESWEAAGRPDPWTRKGFQGALANSGTTVLCAENEKNPVGFAVIKQDDSDRAYIENWAVNPRERKKGGGTHFMQQLLWWAQFHGIRKIVLDVDPANAAATAVYRKMGWKKIDRRPNAYPNGDPADVYEIRIGG